MRGSAKGRFQPLTYQAAAFEGSILFPIEGWHFFRMVSTVSGQWLSLLCRYAQVFLSCIGMVKLKTNQLKPLLSLAVRLNTQVSKYRTCLSMYMAPHSWVDCVGFWVCFAPLFPPSLPVCIAALSASARHLLLATSGSTHLHVSACSQYPYACTWLLSAPHACYYQAVFWCFFLYYHTLLIVLQVGKQSTTATPKNT